ncbi:PREDICTED: gypsy retrotransposon integrase-like protein 1-like [Fragaria vesca subsp. vesca]
MDPIIEFLKEGVRPENRRQARKLQSRCARYTLIDGKLYRRGYRFPSLKCVSVEEGEAILRDIHEGVCGNHYGSRSMSFKALRTGYFWPNMGKMADQMSARCHKCHQHANKIYSPSIALSILMSPWPFAQWGMDLIGKLPTAPGQYKYAIMAVDYYIKWVEAEPVSRITTKSVKNFLMKNIYYRFSIPETIITENGTQFNNPKLIEFTEGMGTRMLFASVAYPKTNRQVEAVNKIIKKLLKKKLDDEKGLWAQRLPETLWAIRTTATRSTGETPFSLAFGTEAVIPIELTVPSGRVEGYNEDTNAEGL